MAWPSWLIDTQHFDSQADTPSRVDVYQMARAVAAILASRGVDIASVVNGKVPDAQLGRAQPNGVAPLDGNRKIPTGYLPTTLSNPTSSRFLARTAVGAAGGAASLDANGKVPAAQLPKKWLFGPRGSLPIRHPRSGWATTGDIDLHDGDDVVVQISQTYGRVEAMTSLLWNARGTPDYLLAGRQDGSTDLVLGLRARSQALQLSYVQGHSLPTLVGVLKI